MKTLEEVVQFIGWMILGLIGIAAGVVTAAVMVLVAIAAGISGIIVDALWPGKDKR
jgi:hypothetical protein